MLALFGVALFLSLGYWQLQRTDYKAAIEQAFEQRLHTPYQPVSAKQLRRELADSTIQFRKVMLTGRFDNAHNLLVDNQLYRGRAGYHVLTPFLPSDGGNLLLVDRGWVDWGGSRARLPEIPALVGETTVAGIAHIPEPPGYQIGEISLGESWPQVIPFIRIEPLQPHFSGKLFPFVLWMAPEFQGHYVRDWNPLWMKPEKSFAYAVQWFVFALIAVVLFFMFSLKKN